MSTFAGLEGVGSTGGGGVDDDGDADGASDGRDEMDDLPLT